jgi:hypothetical protein
VLYANNTLIVIVSKKISLRKMEEIEMFEEVLDGEVNGTGEV